MVSLYGAQPRPLPVGPSTAYQPTAQQVIDAWGPATRGVMLASPANPTGTRIDARELAGIAAAVRERGGFLIVDEIYLGLTHRADAQGLLASAVSLGEDIIVTNSFSKYFSMTGWRLGWIVAPAGLLREVEKLSQNLYVSPPTLSQHAALAAFEPDSLAILEARRREFGARRDLLVPALRSMGFEIPIVPDGAFYIYADCSRLAPDASTLARGLLETAGVAITPGNDFGEHGASRHVRFAYTRSRDEIAEGIERMRRALGGSA
jgi:aspartate/methionine/tyrosine aminotransferase